jgi:diguanylate cyclase (GGDEF)-like protein
MYSSVSEQKSITELHSKEDAIQSEVENVFNNALTVSDGYFSYVESNINCTKEESETFLDYLLSYQNTYIKNIALLEDTTIKYNYPYEENQTSIGVDLSTIPSQKEDVLTVKNSLRPLFVGPTELVQGGNAYILRLPVLDDDDAYWGQISVVIDADLFEALILRNSLTDGIDFRIYDNFSNKQILEFGTPNSENLHVTNNYTNEYFFWTITVYESSNTTHFYQTLFPRLIGYIIILLLGYLFYRDLLIKNQEILNSKHDSLTSLFNRSKFIEDYNNGQINNCLIAFIDVNKFKLLNDTLGHLFGDWCLIQLSNHFKKLPNINAYRMGGDEFVLTSTIPMTIDKFKNLIHTTKFTFYSNEFKQNVDIEISLGILESVSENISLESLLVYLDYAMYDAKKEHIGITIVDKSLMKEYDDTKLIEQQLIHDIKNNKLIPYYQPIIDLKTKKIAGFEVLSRWYYNGEIRSATIFIETVKKIKYVDLVDKHLFNKLQQEYLDLLEHNPSIKNMYFAINFSAETLMIFERTNEMFDKFVKDRVIPKDKIIFEISEDMNLGMISIETLRYIQNKGYAVSVDDFGAGVSKLSDVLSGEIKTIKTDKSLLPTSKRRTEQLDAFNTIINAIKVSGSTICVEGIETQEQLKLAIKAGCTLAQGFLFSKPIPKDEVLEFIKNFDYSKYETNPKQ